MTEPIQTQCHGPILEITINRGKANAIDTTTSHALYQVLAQLNDDPELQVAIITGAGDRFFSAGWDLRAAADGEAVDADHGPGGFAGLTEFFELKKPIIAAVNGLAVGGGFELALACDLIIAVEHAEFFLPEVNIGMVADSGGVFHLPRRLPRPIAMEMLYSGRRLDAKDALRWGLINDVCAAEDLLSCARRLAERICLSAPLAIQAVCEITKATEHQSIAQAYRTLRTDSMPVYQAMLHSEDVLEGPRAFAEQRDPVWKGR
jgi:crotonobetainyl-CoA hydratase